MFVNKVESARNETGDNHWKGRIGGNDIIGGQVSSLKTKHPSPRYNDISTAEEIVRQGKIKQSHCGVLAECSFFILKLEWNGNLGTAQVVQNLRTEIRVWRV